MGLVAFWGSFERKRRARTDVRFPALGVAKTINYDHICGLGDDAMIYVKRVSNYLFKRLKWQKHVQHPRLMYARTSNGNNVLYIGTYMQK